MGYIKSIPRNFAIDVLIRDFCLKDEIEIN